MKNIISLTSHNIDSINANIRLNFSTKHIHNLILKIIVSLLFIIGVSYCIYLIPYILYMGVSWSFVFVWLPKTVKIALYFTYITIWGVYIYSLITSFYKKHRHK